AEVLSELEPVTYWFVWAPEKVRYRKTVHFFLMRATGGEPTADDFEVEEVRFFPLAVAAKRASYASEKKVLESAHRALSG
ncbi:MAG: NUDIX hydrolase, partial [Actinomycetota bacterium]